MCVDIVCAASVYRAKESGVEEFSESEISNSN